MTPTDAPAEALLLSPAQVADLLGCAEWRVRALIRRGGLPVVHLGGTAKHPRIPRVTRAAVAALRLTAKMNPRPEGFPKWL